MGAMRILVVEDQADNRELMERLLRLNGHEVLGAGGVQEALAVTGHDEERLVDACRQAGFFDFVRKPVLFSRLLAAVDAARAASRDSSPRAREGETPARPR